MLPKQWTWLLCSVSVILAKKLSLQELTQLIRIKLLISRFPKNFAFSPQFPWGTNARSPLRTPMLLSRATIRPLFEIHVHFFHQNEIFSENIQKCPPLCIYYSTKVQSVAWPEVWARVETKLKRAYWPALKKNLRNEGESGRGWLY